MPLVAADLARAVTLPESPAAPVGESGLPTQRVLYITLAYVAVAALWIVASDALLLRIAPDPESLSLLDSLNGLGFVAVTAAALYAGLRYWGRALQRSMSGIAVRERLLEAIRREAPVGIAVLDGREQVASWNPATERLLGWREADVLGRPAPWHPDGTAGSPTWVARARHGERVTDAEVRLRRRDGSWVEALVSAAPLMADGQPVGVVAVLVDLTQQRRLEAQLRQAQKMEALGQVAGGIAHDFRNVLTVVSSLGESIRARVGTDPGGELLADLDELMRAADRGAAVTRRLLAFGRIETLRLRPTDMRQEIQEAVRVLRRLLPATIDVVADLPRDGMPVNVDANAMIHILTNLATNARDAMPQGGRLEFAVRRADGGGGATDGRVAVEVTDTGAGMDEATLARVFDPFFTTKPAGIGTGLGLPIVQGLMAEQGGTMSLESKVGGGTTVRLLFPLAPTTLTRSSASPGVIRGGDETILVVEDEDAIRRVAQRSLERFGYTVLVAADGAEALALLRTGRHVDLVISDAVMPRMTGLELHERLQREGIAARFLLASGYWPEEGSNTAPIPPDVPFLPKPWMVNELARKARELLDQS
jgi:two-component system cell cycle sensor histidine kinase/response regulator CckA